MKKLVYVTVSYEYVVVIDDESSMGAQYCAVADYATEALNDMGSFSADFDIVDFDPTNAQHTKSWGSNALPYGGDRDKTILEYL